jgi:hypothetical protein
MRPRMGERDPARQRPALRTPPRLARLGGAATVAAAALLLAAMFAYPGGSGELPAAPGFDPWHNYFCDLIRPVAHGGGDNATGMLLARAGVVATALALVPVWLLLPLLFAAHPAARWCRGPGLLAAAALPAVALTPSDTLPHWHTLTNAGAGLPGAVAMCAGALGIAAVRHRHRRLFWLTLLLLFASVVTAGLWTAAMVWVWPGRWALPCMQKLGWLLLLAWMLAALASGAAACARRSAASGPC